jgi:signal transduction histidine kinase
MTTNYVLKKEKDLLSKTYSNYYKNINDKILSIIETKNNATLALTLTLSSNDNIKKIFYNKNNNLDLSRLSKQLRTNTKFKNVWFHIINNKGRSIYRSWTYKKHDKIVAFRKDLSQMIKNPKIRTTISVGRYDMTFKAMVPIYDGTKFLGILESITHFNSITRGLRLSDKVEPIIIIEKKFTKQLKEKSFSKILLKDYVVANLSVDNKIIKYFDNKNVDSYLTIKDYKIEKDYIITNTEIKYKDEKLASFLTFKKLDDITIEYIKEYKKNTFIYLLLFLVLLGLILFIISYYLYSKELRKLYVKLNKNQNELSSINNSLQETIDEEVGKNFEKNKLMFHQHKMAAMGEMIGNIAHQWRQPLSIITTAASGIKLKKELGIDDGNDVESLDTIVRSANYLSNTIDDFRYFFSSEKTKDTVNSEIVFNKVLSLLKPEYDVQNIKLIKNIDSFEVCIYQNELIQVLINILNNARDELVKIEDYEKRYILIDLHKDNENIIIKIKDNASGIPEDILNRIFEPYFTTKHKSQGTGIGLYMSKEIIVKHMKGDMMVENVKIIIEGNSYIGAEFTLIIPFDLNK